MPYVPASPIAALAENTTPGRAAGPQIMDDAIGAIVQTVNENYDSAQATNNGLGGHRTNPVLDHPDQSVTTAKIKDVNVTTPKLADQAVTTPKLAVGGVTSDRIANGAVGSVQLDPALLQNFGDIAVQAKFVKVDAQLADISIDVKYPPAPLASAIGDGVTNDSGTIQSILNYVSGLSNKNVKIIGNGRTYYINSTIVMPENITLENFIFKPSPTLAIAISVGNGIVRHSYANLKSIYIDATNGKSDLIGIYGKFIAYNNFSDVQFFGILSSSQTAFRFDGLEHFSANHLHVYRAGTGLSIQNVPSGVNNVKFTVTYLADCATGLDVGNFDSATFDMIYFEGCQIGITTFATVATIINPVFDAVTSHWLNYTFGGGSSLVIISSVYTVSQFNSKVNDVIRASSTLFMGKNSIGVNKISPSTNRKSQFFSMGANPDISDQKILIYPNDYDGTNDSFTTSDGIALVYRDSSFGSIRFLTQDGTERVRIFGDGRIQLGGGPFVFKGTGTPEGNWSAPVGSLYMRTNGGAGTSLYVKEIGTGNTGWVAK